MGDSAFYNATSQETLLGVLLFPSGLSTLAFARIWIVTGHEPADLTLGAKPGMGLRKSVKKKRAMMDVDYMACKQENSIRERQITMNEHAKELRLEEEGMRMLEHDDMIWNGRLVLDEIMEEELGLLEEDPRIIQTEPMIMEDEESIMDGQSAMDEQLEEEEWEKYKEEMRILEKEGLIWTSQQRVLEGKMEEELGLLEEDVWIIQTGPMVWEEEESIMDGQIVMDENEMLMEKDLWVSKGVMLDEIWMSKTEEDLTANEDTEDREEPLVWREQLIKNEKSIMNEEWSKIVEEIIKDGERKAIIPEMKNPMNLTDNGMERSMRENDLRFEDFLMYEELMMGEVSTMGQLSAINEKVKEYYHGTEIEESVDYEQGIMDEMHLTSPVTRAQQGIFTYDVLDQPEHNIRAVRLHPRRWRTDPMIICDIITLDLNTGPWYEALSYEWGNPSTSTRYTILLNNKSIVVRENLWWALYELRDAHQPRTLWIDAICINQSDVHERNCQVSRMGDIYSQAARVVAWIGQANFESSHAICTPWHHRCKWEALRSLCSRSYWSRLWIVQEVLLASELHIQCGSLSFQWEELSNVFHDLRQVSTVSCPSFIKLSVVSSVPFRLDMRRKKHQMAVLANNNDDLLPLLDLVDLFKNALCFDDRDKIFGLRSLGLPCCKNAVMTDYSMDREGVINTLLAHHEAQHP
jgi:hypothetical protein